MIKCEFPRQFACSLKRTQLLPYLPISYLFLLKRSFHCFNIHMLKFEIRMNCSILFVTYKLEVPKTIKLNKKEKRYSGILTNVKSPLVFLGVSDISLGDIVYYVFEKKSINLEGFGVISFPYQRSLF